MENTINFVLFGDTKKYLKLTLKKKQEILNVYPNSNVYLYTEDSLNESHLSNSRIYKEGFGHWSWKPWIIIEVLNKINENDCVFYIDSRTKIPKTKSDLLERFIISNYDAMFYHGPLPERNWTSDELFRQLNVDICSLTAVSGQIGGGFIVLKKNRFTIELMHEWQRLLNSTLHIKSQTNNFDFNPYFKLHRHDQSCLSLTLKSTSIPISSCYLSKSEIFAQDSFIPHYEKVPNMVNEKRFYKFLPKQLIPIIKLLYIRSKFLQMIAEKLP